VSSQHILLVGIALVALTAGATGVAAADYQVDIDVPTEPTAGEQTTIEGAVTTEDRPGDWDADVVVTLFVDGEQAAQRTVTVQDGETARVAFEHTFASAGDHRVRLKGETSYGEWSYSDSVTRTVTVAAPPTEVPTATPPVETAQYEGAAFAVPPGLEDEVDDLRGELDELGPHAFVLATESELYLVFTTTEPTSGMATVTGVTTGESVTVNGTSLSVVAATESSFTTTGEPVALSALVADPAAYELDLVRVEGTSSRIASVANSDDGSGTDLPTTAGQLSATGVTDRLRDGMLERAALTTTEDASARPGGEGIATTQARTAFWQETDIRTDAIVVTEDSPARRYLEATTPDSSLALPEDGAVLYVVDEARSPTTVDVEAVTAGEAPEEELIQFTAPVGQVRVSVEESLEESTSCEDAIPVKEACVPLTQDVTVHSGVIWTGSAGGPEETAVLVGASSRLQQESVTTASGEYRVTGEIVAADSVDLPTGDAAQVVLVYDLEQQGTVVDVPTEVETRRTALGDAAEAAAIEQNDTAAESLGGAQTGDTGGEAGSGGDDDGEAGDGQDNAAEATTPATDDATAADGSGPGVAVVLLAVTGTVLASRRRQ
jgi:hypothetical protein